MIVYYLCGALVTAVAAMGGVFRVSDPDAAVNPRTRAVVAVLAGALWPLIAVGALQALCLSLLSSRRIWAQLGSSEVRTPGELRLVS